LVQDNGPLFAHKGYGFYRAGLDLEGECIALCFATEDQKEGMAAFLQKRKPEFKGK